MTDIVGRLRDEPHRVSTGLVLEAAAEIERLKAALQLIRDIDVYALECAPALADLALKGEEL